MSEENTELLTKPKVAAPAPCEVELEEGKQYFFCTCGLSAKQPFCDGSHKGVSELKSFKFVAEKTGKHWLCQCKQTKGQPFCDGSHNNLQP